MKLLANVLVAVVAVAHLAFMKLEMFDWQTPKGLRIFGMTADKAAASAVLAANQGLYNGVLAAGLLASFLVPAPAARALRIYILAAIAVVGLYGAWSVKPRIFFLQPLPALLALAAVLIAN
jgi:putative membrane protein